MTQAEKLQELRALKDPAFALGREMVRFAGQIKIAQGEKGDPGITPQFGVDYFTPEQVLKIVEIAVAEARKLIKDGEKGDPGESIEGKPGKAGRTPVRGEDYWTEADRKAIVAEVQKNVKNGKNGVAPKTSTIVDAVLAAMSNQQIPYARLEGAPDPKSLAELVAYLKRGGYRGGGSASSGPVTSAGAVISATNTGDGKHYTLALVPTTTAYYVIINNGVYTTDDASFGFTAVGTALTFTNTLPADLQNTLIKLVCV